MARCVVSILMAAVAGGMVAMATGHAADLSKQTAVEVVVELGTKDGKRVFSPSSLTFEAGKLYKLVLKNLSGEDHYFSSPPFGAAVWSRKVEAGKAEVKGNIREIEVKPGGEAEWYFVPVQAGTFDLQCTIPGHAAAGMTGKLTVE